MKTKERQKSFEGADLKGKTIVFIGGSDGMGKAAVTKLAAMGATILLLGRNEAKTKAVVTELNAIAKKENTQYWITAANQMFVVNRFACVLYKKEQKALLVDCSFLYNKKSTSF